jgi:hypothetical protein
MNIPSGIASSEPPMPRNRPPQELTKLSRGTPIWELLRRNWHPIGLAADATDVPRKVRVLDEDISIGRGDVSQISGPVYCSSRAQASAP